MFWSRVLDDKNQFIVPVPVIESSSGSFSAYPGFSPLTGSYGSRSIQNVTIPSAAGGFETADLANGRGGTLYYFGSKYDQKIGDWQLLNNFMVDGGELNTNALFSGPNPRPLSYYLYGCQVAQPAGYCNGATAIDTNNLGTGGQGLPLSTNVQATYAGSGLPVSANQSVLTQGWWYIQKTLQNITDEFRISREIFSGNTVTGGIYLARYSDDDNWSLGNTMLMANVPNTQAINLEYVNGGHTYHLTSSQGFVNFNGNFNILEHGNAMNTAGYLSDAWKLGPWLFDVSARLENINAHQRTCNRSNVQMGSQYDLYDNAVPTCNGTFAYEHYVRTRPVFTGGANYEITQNMSAYFRANTGVHYDDFDNGIRGTTNNLFAPLETVVNYEVGYKWQTAISYLDVSAYHRVFDGLQYQESNLEGVPFGPISTYGSTTKGIDVVGTLTPFKGFNIRVVGDYEDGKFQDYIGCLKYIDINGNPQCAQINGSPLERQPKFQIRVTPSYTVVPGPWGDVTAWVTYEHVGQRYEDLTGLQPLGSYYMLSAGIVTDIGNNWEFRVQGTNLTNQIGLTEGNARVTGGESGVGGVLLARPYEGREVNVTAKYKF